MSLKNRPSSALVRCSTSISFSNAKNSFFPLNQPKNRQKLHKIIPDMQELIKSTTDRTGSASTQLINSKFVKKGAKYNHKNHQKDPFNVEKQTSQSDNKKLFLSRIKSNRTTKNSTKLQTKRTMADYKHSVQMRHQSDLSNRQGNIFDFQMNSFFNIAQNRHECAQKNKTDKKIMKSGSEAIFQRPKTASISHTPIIKNIRATTAAQINSYHHARDQTTNFKEGSDLLGVFLQGKNIYAIKDGFDSCAMSNFQRKGKGFTNFIQKNKRQLSNASKKSSFYLTGVAADNSSNSKALQVQGQMHKISLSKLQQSELAESSSPLKQHNISFKPVVQAFQTQEEAFQSPKLSKQQISSYRHRNKQNIEFMKKHMPDQYKKFVDFLRLKDSQNNKNAVSQHEYQNRVLLSKNIDQQNNQFRKVDQKSQQETMQLAKQYYDEFIEICENTQRSLRISNRDHKTNKSKRFARQDVLKDKNTQQNTILNVLECQKVLELENERNQLKKQICNDADSMKKTTAKQSLSQISLKIYQLVKKLKYFAKKSDQKNHQLFQTNFSIASIREDSSVAKVGQHIDTIFVILSGSVVKEEAFVNKQNYIRDSTIVSLEQYKNRSTIFDGESCGQPPQSSPFQSINQNMNYNYSLTTSQHTLLMKIPLSEYRAIFVDNDSELKRKIDLINHIFGNVHGANTLQNVTFEAIAAKLRTKTYMAKQVIFRQGQPCNELIIVADGRISVGSEQILKRKKLSSKDMKYRSKRSSSNLQPNEFSMKNFRRKNLKNYQIIKQNQEEFMFYYQHVTSELNKGNTFNWQGFSPVQGKHNNLNQNFDGSSSFKLKNCLISNSDRTTIYTLRLSDLKNFSEYVKQVIKIKVESQHKKNTKQTAKRPDPVKWDQYKQQLCDKIVRNKIRI